MSMFRMERHCPLCDKLALKLFILKFDIILMLRLLLWRPIRYKIVLVAFIILYIFNRHSFPF